MNGHWKNSDSTDLLLDAMCNVFGVVLLVAIIIGGLSISKRIIAGGGVSYETAEQARKLYMSVNSQLKAAQTRRQLLQDLLKGAPVSSKTVKVDQTLAGQHQQLVIKANSMADTIEALDRAVTAEKSMLNRLKNSSAEQEKALIAKLNRIIGTELKTPAITYGASSTDSLVPLRFIVDAEKIYYIGSNQDIYRGNTENSAVNIRSFKQSGQRYFHISKRPEKGVSLKDPAECISLQFVADKHFVELSVEKSAIAAAAGVISYLRKNNIPFAWRIIPEEGTVLRTAEKGNYEVSY